MTINRKIICMYLVIGFIISIPFLSNKYLFLLDTTPIITIYKVFDIFYGNVSYGEILSFNIILNIILIGAFQKEIFFIVLFLSGHAMYNLSDRMIVKKNIGPYSGLLYMANPYTYTRLFTGHWYILLSYATIPLLLKTFINLLEKKGKKEMVKSIFLLSIVALSIHMLMIALIIMTIMFLFNRYKDMRTIKILLLYGIIFILLNSYWIIPVLTAKNKLVDNITDKDFEEFSPKGDIFTLATMYGFWREGYIYTKDILPYWQIFYLIILGLSIYGFISYYKDENLGRHARAFALIGIIGLILALGIKGPLYFLYSTDNIILKGFRDSHKFVAMLALSYSVLGGLGINKLEEMRRKFRK